MKKTSNYQALHMALATLSCLPMKGQEKVVPFKYGNMDHWVIRNIKESGYYRR